MKKIIATLLLISSPAFADLTVKVEGMTCGACAAAIKRALANEQGVESVTVDVDTGTVVVKEKAGEQALESSVQEKISKAGYKVVSVTKS